MPSCHPAILTLALLPSHYLATSPSSGRPSCHPHHLTISPSDLLTSLSSHCFTIKSPYIDTIIHLTFLPPYQPTNLQCHRPTISPRYRLAISHHVTTSPSPTTSDARWLRTLTITIAHYWAGRQRHALSLRVPRGAAGAHHILTCVYMLVYLLILILLVLLLVLLLGAHRAHVRAQTGLSRLRRCLSFPLARRQRRWRQRRWRQREGGGTRLVE